MTYANKIWLFLAFLVLIICCPNSLLAQKKAIKQAAQTMDKANNPEPTSPCPKGVMRYFKVVSFTCL
jgi:hypothetical protein